MNFIQERLIIKGVVFWRARIGIGISDLYCPFDEERGWKEGGAGDEMDEGIV